MDCSNKEKFIHYLDSMRPEERESAFKAKSITTSTFLFPDHQRSSTYDDYWVLNKEREGDFTFLKVKKKVIKVVKKINKINI